MGTSCDLYIIMYLLRTYYYTDQDVWAYRYSRKKIQKGAQIYCFWVLWGGVQYIGFIFNKIDIIYLHRSIHTRQKRNKIYYTMKTRLELLLQSVVVQSMVYNVSIKWITIYESILQSKVLITMVTLRANDDLSACLYVHRPR